MGEIYNVDSKDEIENLDLAKKLCKAFGVEDFESRIQYTRDRPFNDCRYAVNGDKLAKLGWKQKVIFEDGLAQCVDWYQKFSTWWGDIDNILTPFPELSNKAVGAGLETVFSEESSAGKAGLQQAEVGAEPYDPASAGKKQKKPNGNPASNGVAFKKRKAEALEQE